MTALEKAAKAMFEINRLIFGPEMQWEELPTWAQKEYIDDARAAIESLRTPGAENSDRIFNAMLDRILKEETSK